MAKWERNGWERDGKIACYLRQTAQCFMQLLCALLFLSLLKLLTRSTRGESTRTASNKKKHTDILVTEDDLMPDQIQSRSEYQITCRWILKHQLIRSSSPMQFTLVSMLHQMFAILYNRLVKIVLGEAGIFHFPYTRIAALKMTRISIIIYHT